MCRVEDNLAAVGADDGLNDRETEAGATLVAAAGGVEALKRSKMRARSSGGTPSPSSVTVSVTAPASSRRARSTRELA